VAPAKLGTGLGTRVISAGKHRRVGPVVSHRVVGLPRAGGELHLGVRKDLEHGWEGQHSIKRQTKQASIVQSLVPVTATLGGQRSIIPGSRIPQPPRPRWDS